MSDRITVTGISAMGRHGVLPFEHEVAQPFVVDVTLSVDLAAAGASDALADTVDYGGLAARVVAVVEGRHADLIEALAERIAAECLADDRVERAEVTVHKPNAPVAVPVRDVAVTVVRGRR